MRRIIPGVLKSQVNGFLSMVFIAVFAYGAGLVIYKTAHYDGDPQLNIALTSGLLN